MRWKEVYSILAIPAHRDLETILEIYKLKSAHLILQIAKFCLSTQFVVSRDVEKSMCLGNLSLVFPDTYAVA